MLTSFSRRCFLQATLCSSKVPDIFRLESSFLLSKYLLIAPGEKSRLITKKTSRLFCRRASKDLHFIIEIENSQFSPPLSRIVSSTSRFVISLLAVESNLKKENVSLKNFCRKIHLKKVNMIYVIPLTCLKSFEPNSLIFFAALSQKSFVYGSHGTLQKI